MPAIILIIISLSRRARWPQPLKASSGAEMIVIHALLPPRFFFLDFLDSLLFVWFASFRKDVLAQLSKLEPGDPRRPAAVELVTSNFDKFSDNGEVRAIPTYVQAKPRYSAQLFIVQTYGIKYGMWNWRGGVGV